MEKTNSAHAGGVGTLGLLGCLFVGLKLTGHIGWSWWWVTAPFWGPVAAVVGFFVTYVLCGLLYLALNEVFGHLKGSVDQK